MKIVLSGVETNNKGAELMLYAILQEIEHRYPEADVYISKYRVQQGLDYIRTSLSLHYLPFEKEIEFMHVNGILKRLRLPLLECINFVKADYFLDGSGFVFSDQCRLWGTTPEWWERILKNMYKKGAKIIFLPQAFGPFEMELTKRAVAVLNRYSTLIMPREQVSYNYLKETGIVDMIKLKLYPDFTSLVEGVFPKGYEHLKNGICIIPNIRMIKNGKITYKNYIRLLTAIADEGKKSGHPVFLLNHEGSDDAELCLKCKNSIDRSVESVTSLNALEVKGLISSAYLVITSRFHGLASSLNCGVPSLATSWSHKYEELFKEFELENCVLPLDNIEQAVARMKVLIEEKENSKMREQIKKGVPRLKEQARKMWNEVWNC